MIKIYRSLKPSNVTLFYSEIPNWIKEKIECNLNEVSGSKRTFHYFKENSFIENDEDFCRVLKICEMFSFETNDEDNNSLYFATPSLLYYAFLNKEKVSKFLKELLGDISLDYSTNKFTLNRKSTIVENNLLLLLNTVSSRNLPIVVKSVFNFRGYLNLDIETEKINEFLTINFELKTLYRNEGENLDVLFYFDYHFNQRVKINVPSLLSGCPIFYDEDIEGSYFHFTFQVSEIIDDVFLEKKFVLQKDHIFKCVRIITKTMVDENDNFEEHVNEETEFEFKVHPLMLPYVLHDFKELSNSISLYEDPSNYEVRNEDFFNMYYDNFFEEALQYDDEIHEEMEDEDINEDMLNNPLFNRQKFYNEYKNKDNFNPLLMFGGDIERFIEATGAVFMHTVENRKGVLLNF